MKSYLVCAVFAIMLCSCASWPSKPANCFKGEPTISPESAGEVKAVKFVRSRLAASCRPTRVECHLQLQGETGNEIKVIATRALIEGKPGTCTLLEGGSETYIFTPQGDYIRVVLGI